MRAALVLPFLCLIATTGSAATIYVPDSYVTIQDAIIASASGDTIVVRPGTYVENIDFLGKAIGLRSLAGARQTVIDGGGAAPVVTFGTAEGPGSVLEGFTVTNGKGTSGGGISCTGASPTIRGNLVTMNETTGDGGGIHCAAGSDALISGNSIIGNVSSAGRGGGICCDASDPTITGNDISSNTLNGDRGAGIHVRYASPVITGNGITDNLTKVRGGGIYCYEASPHIAGNIVSGNTAQYYGGGIYCYGNSPATIRCNLIVGNEAVLEGGGGIICSGGSDAKILGNTIADNSASTVGGGIWNTSSPTISNNIVWNNTAATDPEIYRATTDVTYSLVRGGWPGVGNIGLDPLFCDSAGNDYHLTWNSPCRDAGDSNAVTELADFEGDPRIVGTVDMGADEFHPHLYCTGQVLPGAPIDIKAVGSPGLPVLLAIGAGIQDPPRATPHGDLRLALPLAGTWKAGPIPGNGILTRPAVVPAAWPSGSRHPFQALVGPWGGGTTRLTNAMVLTVE